MAQRGPPGSPAPPAPLGKGGGAKRDFGGYKSQDVDEYAGHAAEIRALASGRDIVELAPRDTEKRPAAFDRKELGVIRSWVNRRPLEPTQPAAALVEFPRMWATKRGRYCHFKAPGAGTYALLRARPSY